MTWETRRGIKVWAGEPFSDVMEQPTPRPRPKRSGLGRPPGIHSHRASPTDDICGSLSGYRRHLRNDTDVCDDCRDAKRQHDRDTSARKAL